MLQFAKIVINNTAQKHITIPSDFPSIYGLVWQMSHNNLLSSSMGNLIYVSHFFLNKRISVKLFEVDWQMRSKSHVF